MNRFPFSTLLPSNQRSLPFLLLKSYSLAAPSLGHCIFYLVITTRATHLTTTRQNNWYVLFLWIVHLRPYIHDSMYIFDWGITLTHASRRGRGKQVEETMLVLHRPVLLVGLLLALGQVCKSYWMVHYGRIYRFIHYIMYRRQHNVHGSRSQQHESRVWTDSEDGQLRKFYYVNCVTAAFCSSDIISMTATSTFFKWQQLSLTGAHVQRTGQNYLPDSSTMKNWRCLTNNREMISRFYALWVGLPY